MAQITDNNGTLQDSQEIYDGRFGIVAGDHLPADPRPGPPQRPPQAPPLTPRWSARQAAIEFTSRRPQRGVTCTGPIRPNSTA